MFEAYKVGITIALTNKVSSALMLIGKDLKATDAAALRLKNTLKEIKLLGIAGALVGGTGLIGLRLLDKSYEAAKKYEQVLNQFKALNLGDSVNRDADKFARGANIMGASATDLIGTVRDLHTALGDYGMAKQLAPQIAQMKFANKAVFGDHGMDMGDRQLQAMEKIIEMKGGFKSPDAFMAQANMMQKVISGTGGMVKPSDFMNFIKTAGVAGRLLSNEMFYYTMEPLIQEMTGGRVGTGTMSAYNNLAQGRSTVRAAKEMMRLGILNPSMVEYDKIGQVKRILPGALKGMDEYTSNPYQWMKDVLIPHMAAKGITSESGVLNEMGAIFGNRTGSNLFSLMFLQQDKIAKNMAISQKAMDVGQLLKLAKSSPQGAEMALGMAVENLHIAAGRALLPIIIPGLLKLADALRSLGEWIDHHPVRFDYLVKGFAGLAAAMTIGGTILLLTAAFKGLALVLRLSSFVPMLKMFGTAFSTFGRLFLVSGPVGLTIAGIGIVVTAAYEIYTHWDSIKPKLLGVWEGVKNWLSNMLDWIGGVGKNLGSFGPGNLSGHTGGGRFGSWHAPAPATQTLIVNNHMDPEKNARSVFRIGANRMSGPSTSGAGYNPRIDHMPTGVSASW